MVYVLDTSAIRHILDGHFKLDILPDDAKYAITHIQVDEVAGTGDPQLRARLLLLMFSMHLVLLPTETLVWGHTRWDNARWGNGKAYQSMRNRMKQNPKFKDNNIKDSLTAEVALRRGYTLITGDRDQLQAAQEMGCEVIYTLNSCG